MKVKAGTVQRGCQQQCATAAQLVHESFNFHGVPFRRFYGDAFGRPLLSRFCIDLGGCFSGDTSSEVFLSQAAVFPLDSIVVTVTGPGFPRHGMYTFELWNIFRNPPAIPSNELITHFDDCNNAIYSRRHDGETARHAGLCRRFAVFAGDIRILVD